MATEEHPHGPGVNTGGVVKPVYSSREMRCLVVSESELKQIGLANLGVTIFAAIGSALMSFSIDVMKDMVLTPPAAQATADLAERLNNLTFWAGAVCWFIGGCLWFWRRDMIKTIQRESRGPTED